jgi:hypothetical protein
MILLMLPPKTSQAGHAQPGPASRARLADHILTEGLRKGEVDMQAGLGSEAGPRSEGSGEFLSRFSARMKDTIADLAIRGFSDDPRVLVDAACMLAVLSPLPEELEILAAAFDSRDRIEGRFTLQKLAEAGLISFADMGRFMSMENRMFPALPGYEEMPGAPSDEAPPTKRSVPPSGPAGRSISVKVTGGYTDAQGHTGYEFVASKR